jgi:hypothetical protein
MVDFNTELAARTIAKHEKLVAEAVAEHDGLWPAELFSGIMFWRGERITREEFEGQPWVAR